MGPIDRQLFQETMLEEFREAWHTLHRAHPGEHFYAFGLYTAERAEYLMVTASTEEGLASIANPPTAAALRWSPCDSPLHAEGTELLQRSDRLRRSGPDPYEDSVESDEAVTLVSDVAVDVLKRLDDEGLFGAGIERARLVLGIFRGDQTDEERLDFAYRLNPRRVVERFARELREG